MIMRPQSGETLMQQPRYATERHREPKLGLSPEVVAVGLAAVISVALMALLDNLI